MQSLIGYNQQERFQSFYTLIEPTERHFFTTPLAQLPFIVFILRKSDLHQDSSSLIGHVFSTQRESLAFDLCDLMKKLISQRSILPNFSQRRTLLNIPESSNDHVQQQRIKYFKRDQTKVSMMEFCQGNSSIDQRIQVITSNFDCPLSRSCVDVANDTITNPSLNPSSLLINTVENSPLSRDRTSQVLTIPNDNDYMSLPFVSTYSIKQQRHFIKTSSLIKDESEEILEDLVNLVAMEKFKDQQTAKRLNSPMERPERIHSFHSDAHILRPSMVVNRYPDIGNYVPKLLRDNVTTRSSDCNENIFFRSSHGQLLNGFLQLDVSASKPIKEKVHYQSMININVQPEPYLLRTNRT